MKNMLLGLGILLITGCGNTVNFASSHTTNVAVENIGSMTKSEMAKKHLHTHSYMQSLMQLSTQERYHTIFGPDDDDIFVTNAYPDSWSQAIKNMKRVKSIDIRVGHLSKDGIRRVRIKDKRQSVYTKAKNHYIYPRVLQGDKFSGKYIINTDQTVQSIIARMYFPNPEKQSLEKMMNRLFSVANSEGKDIYFSLNSKSKVLKVSGVPAYHRMTPYKRQFFVNFLNSAGIGYTTIGNSVAIKDNFTNWVTGMNKLRKLNKYRHAVYAVHDGKNFFEVSDGSYQTAPVTIELIDWIPGGKREYNIYSHGYNRKIDTNKRFYDFYLPDGSKKYTIRFY